jgi:hypothetical protein
MEGGRHPIRPEGDVVGDIEGALEGSHPTRRGELPSHIVHMAQSPATQVTVQESRPLDADDLQAVGCVVRQVLP